MDKVLFMLGIGMDIGLSFILKDVNIVGVLSVCKARGILE